MAVKKIEEVGIGHTPRLPDIDSPQFSVLDPVPDRRLADLEPLGDFLNRLISIPWHQMAPFAVFS